MDKAVRELLREKYSEMRALRTDTTAAPDKEKLVLFAARFPGALREIDELPLSVIEQRYEALMRDNDDEPWMVPTARFHLLMRSALAAKRWLGGNRVVTEANRAACAAESFSEWTEQLDHIASPPKGRISLVVLERLAREQDLTIDELRQLVMPHARVFRH